MTSFLGSKGDSAEFAPRRRRLGYGAVHGCLLAAIVKARGEKQGSDSEGIWRLNPTEQWRGGCDEREEDSWALATS